MFAPFSAPFMEAAHQLAQTFGLSWGTFIPYLVNFILILIVLRIFAYKPLLAMLDERRNIIAKSMAQAEEIKQELAKTQAAREEILSKANSSAQKMIDEARQAAEKFRDQKLNEALQSAQETLRKAQEAGRLEREKIMADLRKEMVSLVVTTTAKVAGKVLTSEDQKRLSDETLKQLAA